MLWKVLRSLFPSAGQTLVWQQEKILRKCTTEVIYRQKLEREAPALRTIQCWLDQSDAILQDCFDHVDWDMFRAASDDDIEVYSDTVTRFIRKCIEDVVPTKNNPHLLQLKTVD